MGKHKISKDTFYLLSFLALLFIFAFRIWKPSFCFAGMFAIVLIWAFQRKTKALFVPRQPDFILLSLAFISYFLIDQFHHGEFSVRYFLSQAFHLLSMPTAYWIGWLVSSLQKEKEREAIFRNAWYLIATGSSLYAVLSLLKKYLFPGLYTASFQASEFASDGFQSGKFMRGVIDVWNNDFLNATEFCTQLLYLIVVLPLFFISRPKRRSPLIIGVCFGIVLWTSYATTSRSNLALTILAIIHGLAYYGILKVQNYHLIKALGQKSKKFITLLTSFSVLAVITLIMFSVSFLNHLKIGSNLNRLTSLSLSEIMNGNGRWKFAFEVLQALRNHPFGGLYDMMWAHNLWLDVGRLAGWIPMVFLVLFTLSNVYLVIRLWRSDVLNPETHLLGLSILMILNASFFLEPVIEGSPQQFMFYSLAIGFLNHLLSAHSTDPLNAL